MKKSVSRSTTMKDNIGPRIKQLTQEKLRNVLIVTAVFIGVQALVDVAGFAWKLISVFVKISG